MKGQMLPGVAAICMFMLVLTMINAFAAVNGKYWSGGGKYGVLASVYAAGGGSVWSAATVALGMGAGACGMFDAEPGKFICVREDARWAVFSTGTFCVDVLFVPGADGGPGPVALGGGEFLMDEACGGDVGGGDAEGFEDGGVRALRE